MLLLQAWWELLRYDIRMSFFGFRRVHADLAGKAERGAPDVAVERLCHAINTAVALYWRPVHCLQKSAATTHLLRRHGWRGQLVVGYRSVPFFSHAWVEIDGRVVNDSPAYRQRLRVLESL
jgi:hypothetical protein